jgi:hypothetical protein
MVYAGPIHRILSPREIIMRDLNDNDLNGPDVNEDTWSGQGWGLVKPVVDSGSRFEPGWGLTNPALQGELWSGHGGGLMTPFGGADLDPAVPGAEADSKQPGALDTTLTEGGAETTQGDDDDGGVLNGESPGGLFAEEDDRPGSRPDEGYLAQDDTVDDAFGLETGSFDTAALQSPAPLQAARDSDDGMTARGTDPVTSTVTDSEDGVTGSYQSVEDGFHGPPPPHEFEQSGCACAGCSEVKKGDGQDDFDSTSVGTPTPATSIQDLARFLSEYNSTISGSNGGYDYWDDADSGYESPDFHWNLTDSGTNAKNGTLTYNISGSWWDDNGITDDGADSQTKIDAIRHALNVYEDVLGINFVETTDEAKEDVDIAFGNEESGAFANFNYDWNGGELSNAWINIDENWSGDGTIGDYYFSTVLHEVGHALGLGHAGDYNGSGFTYSDTQ